MLRSLKGTSDSLPIFNLSWKTGKQSDLQMLSHYTEKDITQSNKLASLTFISGTRMDMLPWNFAGNEQDYNYNYYLSDFFFFFFGEVFLKSFSLWF